MPIRIQVRARNQREAQRYIRKVHDELKDPRKGLIKASNKVAAVFEQNFRRQGATVGGWADLAEATIRNRERQGMPTGPVLIKYGALKQVVTDRFMEANGPGQWSKTDPYSPHTTRGRLTIQRGVARLSASGWKVANQYGHPNRSGRPIPPRPFWFVDRNSIAAARRGIEAWIVKDVIR